MKNKNHKLFRTDIRKELMKAWEFNDKNGKKCSRKNASLLLCGVKYGNTWGGGCHILTMEEVNQLDIKIGDIIEESTYLSSGTYHLAENPHELLTEEENRIEKLKRLEFEMWYKYRYEMNEEYYDLIKIEDRISYKSLCVEVAWQTWSSMSTTPRLKI